MASTMCWDCGEAAHMTPIKGSATVRQANFIQWHVMGCFTCDNCKAPNIAIANGNPSNKDALAWLAGKKKLEWKPRPPAPIAVMRTYPDVPSGIAAAASEAYRCQKSASHRAAVLMARSVVEAAAKDKSIGSGSLLSKIDKLPQLRLHVREGAHEIRLLGNDMAHGDVHELS
jgi:Domain of unknown function (DUF4145)